MLSYFHNFFNSDIGISSLSPFPTMGSKSYPIIPLPIPASGEIPKRYEISHLPEGESGRIQLLLFLKALKKFMAMDDLDDELSYFRIAAIHGAPYVGWDGEESPHDPNVPIVDQPSNFCVHNNVTFATWHRPYLLLFERRLYDLMEDVVANAPKDERSQWQAGRENWRLPYWDWASAQPYEQPNDQKYGLPTIATIEKVILDQFLEPNPMWKFVNPKKDSEGNPVAMGDEAYMGCYALPDADQQWSKCKATSRHPKLDVQAFIEGGNEWASVNKEMNNPDWYKPKPVSGEVVDNPKGTIWDLVFRLLSYNYAKYDYFVSAKFHKGPLGSNYLSLEYIHNNIHNFVGGRGTVEHGIGHMEDIAVSSFDPVFWLHHCYIDKLNCMWQLLHENKWLDDQTNKGPLVPFHKDEERTFYTSEDVRAWTDLNYSYDWAFHPHPGAANNSEIIRHINETYGHHRRELLNGPQISGTKNDYVINVVYDRYALGRSYTIHFFLGQVDETVDVTQLSTHASHVGSVFTFSSFAGEQGGRPRCPNCADQQTRGVISKAQVPLTIALLRDARNPEKHELNALFPEDVESYLEGSKFSWKVVQSDGREISLEDKRLKSLKILLMCGKVLHSTDITKPSKYYGYQPMWKPTSGKTCGAVEDDNYLWTPDGRSQSEMKSKHVKLQSYM
ncbi:Di-copper centre-containing protein [Delitschia confertaspora ATCC 74209]|uniref:tyrosinase n=1 Tax=Delitschia confertaspora ATCC 74209 TaxID=1513339 RepID=A0A9P4MY33_9PLEO|nr:Di-copper centre-containing protein [Delitschia confertaspora ATCC 74209]